MCARRPKKPDAPVASLADKTEFVLSPTEWDAFLEILSRPPRVNKPLQKLLSEAPKIQSDLDSSLASFISKKLRN
jgi:hypothetical protein